jgi:hypothetical protein
MKKFKNSLFILAIMFTISNVAHANTGCEKIKEYTVKAVDKAIDKGCGYIAAEFEGACVSATAAETGATSTVPCTVGSGVLGFNCKFFGKKYVKKNAENIGKNICDVVYPDTAPYIFIENHLKEEKVDFKVIVKAGNDIHMHGDNWLDGESTGILASNELDGKHYTVQARVKKDGKDTHLEVHKVVPNQDKVYVYYKDGKYHIEKKATDHKPMIAIENHLDKHKVDFSVVVNNSTDVHLPGDNWLDAGDKNILMSYKLFGKSYTVKARIKKDAEDIHLEEYHVHPGKEGVYVYYKDGKYKIGKKDISYSAD